MEGINYPLLILHKMHKFNYMHSANQVLVRSAAEQTFSIITVRGNCRSGYRSSSSMFSFRLGGRLHQKEMNRKS